MPLMVSVDSRVRLLFQVCVVVLALLLMAGDVERNPGPTKKDQVGEALPTVDNSPLDEDNLFDLLDVLMPIVASWKAIGEGLRLRVGSLEEIKKANHDVPRECMSEMLKCWLRRNYNVKRFGVPTWRTVVKVVADPAAGNYCSLALRIAEKHPVIGAATPENSEQTHTSSVEGSCASCMVSDNVFTSEGASVGSRQSSFTQADESQSEGSPKPPFGCGCGKCTFFSFIESGCTKPINSASLFPYLDVSGLNHEQQQTLRSRLQFESREIMLKFQNVVSIAMNSLMSRGVTVDELVSHLMTLGTFVPVKEEAGVQHLQSCYKDLINAETIPKVFLAIRDYFSFFNTDIIDRIINGLGTEEDKRELQKYKDDFRQYAKRRIFECLPQFGPVSETDHANIFVKVDSHYESYTVQELEGFRYRLGSILHISSQGVLRLCRVEKGCFQLMFQVPSFSKIFPLSSEQEKALVAEKVIKLTCGKYEFVAKEENDSQAENTYSPSVFNYLPPPKPPKKRQCEDPSSFLSTRKRRKIEVSQDPKEEDASQFLKEDDASLNTNTLGCGSVHVTLTDDHASLSHTQHTQNMSKLATEIGLVMPFTCLVFPLGVVCNADNFWKDDNEDGMMLGTGWGEGDDSLGLQEPPRWNYKPMCTEDGFILARSKPKLQASQLQKPGLLSSGSGVGGDTHIEGEKNCAPTAVVDITFVNLVAGRMKGREDGVREEEEEAQTAAKNFKKFRKVRHTDGGIRRILSLVLYIPSANQELQDLDVDVKGMDERNTRLEESSMDLF